MQPFLMLAGICGCMLLACSATEELGAGLSSDDECLAGGQSGSCALNALQLRGEEAENGEDAEMLELANNWHSAPDGILAARCNGRSYCVMGSPHPYMVVAGHRDAIGMESIGGGNLGYYDSLMGAAWSHCGGSSCVLITNPKGFRSQSRFHIHFRQQSGHGKSLKHQMEAKVCKAGGWHKGGFPCGGKAKFFPGHVGAFSAAEGAGGLQGAGVSVWPGSCGGHGAIIMVTYHCSIEHSIGIVPAHSR